MVFVELHQHRGGHHQEVSEGHGDGVGHHGEALAQTTQALKSTKNNESELGGMDRDYFHPQGKLTNYTLFKMQLMIAR